LDELVTSTASSSYLTSSWSPLTSRTRTIRERPDSPGLYDDLGKRGRDMHDILAWIIDDATGLEH
jgi:hypothetical protein